MEKSSLRNCLLLMIFNLLTFCASSQTITQNANLIKVKGVSYIQVCNLLLDSGYVIEKKDNELQTIKTEIKEYKKSFNGAYYLQIRIKDSVAYIRGYFTAPWWDPFTRAANKADPLWKNELAIYTTNKKGKLRDTLYSYPFLKMIELAMGLGKDIDYINE